MITIKDFMETVDYRITEGSQYGWNCFGPNAYTLDSWNQEQDGHTITIVFDTKTQEVYQAEAFDYSANRAYRLINPNYAQAHKDEANLRMVDYREAWEDVRFTDLEVDEDFLNKARAIVAEEEYDERVVMPLDLDDEQLFDLMKLAHERDITLNQMVEEVLRLAIEKHKESLPHFSNTSNPVDFPVTKDKKKKKKGK